MSTLHAIQPVEQQVLEMLAASEIAPWSQTPIRMKSLALALLLAGVVGCYTRVEPKMALISVGMSKADVVGKLGAPSSVAAKGSIEFLTYDSYVRELSNDVRRWDQKQYFVRLVDGKVESFGQKGDFGSTRQPVQEIKEDITIRAGPTDQPTKP